MESNESSSQEITHSTEGGRLLKSQKEDEGGGVGPGGMGRKEGRKEEKVGKWVGKRKEGGGLIVGKSLIKACIYLSF